jgi:hypothetical protein
LSTAQCGELSSRTHRVKKRCGSFLTAPYGLAGFRAKLDADQGYSGLLTKNPVHPRWRVLRGPCLGYELAELADWVELPKHLPKKNPEEIGLGRNVTVFEFLRQWAYRNLRGYKAQGFPGWNPWMAACNARALERNGDFSRPMERGRVRFVPHRTLRAERP